MDMIESIPGACGRVVRRGWLLAAVALTASGCVTTTWTTYHAKNDRSGVANAKALVPTTEAWTSPSLDGAIYGEPLVLANRVIVATENDSVYSLDLDDGHVVWGPVNLGKIGRAHV